MLKLIDKILEILGVKKPQETVVKSKPESVDTKIAEEEVKEEVEAIKETVEKTKMKVAILGALLAPKIFLSFSNIFNTNLQFL